jgi:hypothetical protein
MNELTREPALAVPHLRAAHAALLTAREELERAVAAGEISDYEQYHLFPVEAGNAALYADDLARDRERGGARRDPTGTCRHCGLPIHLGRYRDDPTWLSYRSRVDTPFCKSKGHEHHEPAA